MTGIETVRAAQGSEPGSEVRPPERSIATPILEVQNLSKVYRSSKRETRAIADISFAIDGLEFVSVVGPSGSGKTTLLKCMAGLLAPSGGVTLLHGDRVTAPPSEMAVVFQDYGRSLFPWLTVIGNITLPLRKRMRAKDRTEAAERVLQAVGLAGFEHHYPAQLSGGMQQRVAIARALAYSPRVLLLDEPFASVDAQTRAELEDLVLSLRRDFEVTVLLVTHDIDEAVYMSDRVIVLSRPPSTIQDTLHVPLPWPRDQVATKELPEFSALRGKVYREIMGGRHRTDGPSTAARTDRHDS